MERAAASVLARFLRGNVRRSLFVSLQTMTKDVNLDRSLNDRGFFTTQGEKMMKHFIVPLLLVGGFVALSTMEANAVVCAAGVYRAGCVAARPVARVAVVAPRAAVVAPRRVAVRRRVY
jgi:hypothetical protein